MIYPYECPECKHTFEVIKPVAEIDFVERCEACGMEAERKIAKNQYFYGADDWDNAEYNPGLGQVVKNRKHREQIAKQKGFIEVGNEDPVKLDREFERDRELEIDASWDKV